MADEPTLQEGDSSEWVSYLQRLLTEQGYDTGSEDGSFGAQTQEAVVSFQRASGLPEDGVVGAATWAQLTGQVGDPLGGDSTPSVDFDGDPWFEDGTIKWRAVNNGPTTLGPSSIEDLLIFVDADGAEAHRQGVMSPSDMAGTAPGAIYLSDWEMQYGHMKEGHYTVYVYVNVGSGIYRTLEVDWDGQASSSYDDW